MTSDDIPRIPRKNRPIDDPKKIGPWKVGRTIGKGTSGHVRVARHSRTGQYAAIKIVSKLLLGSRLDALNELGDTAEHAKLSLEREVVVMKLIDHPNIMRLYDVWETSTELYLILEYVQGGELFTYLCEKIRLPPDEALGYFQQIIGAIDYCHRYNISHRDLKPENILLDENKNIKIADFGMAAWQANGAYDGMLRTACGSPHYAAPEIISGDAYDGSRADIWSCGVILHALLVGKLPFDDEELPKLMAKIQLGVFEMPKNISSLAKDLLARMLQTDVKKRITMPEILEHPFYTSRPLKKTNAILPRLDDPSRFVGSVSSVDPDIFKNMVTLWHGVPEEKIMAKLTSNEHTTEKGVYELLAHYRRKQSEALQEDYEDIHHRSKSRRGRHTDTDDRDSLPPRTGPPTPRRAIRNNMSSQRSNDTLSAQISRTAKSLHSTPPLSPLSPLAPVWGALNMLPLNVPEFEDDKIQAFFHQIADQLNAIQAVTMSTPAENSLDSHNAPPTRPLSIRRKADNTYDKENQPEPATEEGFVLVEKGVPAKPKSSLRRRGTGKGKPTDLKVQIMEPNKLKKRWSLAPTSPAFSEAGSSFVLPSPAKKTWFSNVFKARPANSTFLSTRNELITRSECRRLLMAMDVRVQAVDGLFKCRLADIVDPSGIMSTMKAVRFKAEIRAHQLSAEEDRAKIKGKASENTEPYTTELVLIYEKGSAETFREICKRLRRDWELDAQTPSLSKVLQPRLVNVGEPLGIAL